MRVFSWVLWDSEVDPRKHAKDGKMRVTVRSIDKDGNTQDKKVEDIVNIKGMLNNAPHTIEFPV